MENINKSSNDDDKTIIFSSSQKVPTEDSSDKTVLEDHSDKTQIQTPNPTNPQDMENKSTSPNQDSSHSEKMENLKGKTDKSGVSPGAAAAGMAAAAVAGTAAGTIYSDEIKGVFNQDDIKTTEDTTAINSKTELEDSDHASHDNVNNDLKTEVPSVIEISSTDDQGNIYNVSLVDVDSDGHIDYETAKVDFADGSSLNFTVAGDNLDTLNESMNIASTEDHEQLQQVSNVFESEGSSIYEIQAGDTLSEIALANDTSVSEIMEINPTIQDPDLIYAGNEIYLPNNDLNESSNNNDDYLTTSSFENEAEIDSDYSNQNNSDLTSNSVDDVLSEETSNYEEELSNTNFDNFDSTESLDFEADIIDTDL
jgi:LysM repeat protein